MRKQSFGMVRMPSEVQQRVRAIAVLHSEYQGDIVGIAIDLLEKELKKNPDLIVNRRVKKVRKAYGEAAPKC